MERHRLKLRHVADACGVAVSTVGGWRSGKFWPETAVQPKLAALLGVSVDFLIHGTPDSAQSSKTSAQPKSSAYPPVLDEPLRTAETPTGRAATRADCEAYVRAAFDRAQASGDPNAFPYIFRALRKAIPLGDWEETEQDRLEVERIMSRLPDPAPVPAAQTEQPPHRKRGAS